MRGEIQTSSARGTRGSGTDSWGTPREVLARWRRLGPIGLDPCTTDENPVGAVEYLTPLRCGLTTPWGPLVQPRHTVWTNWPYSAAARWAAKVIAEVQRYDLSVGLLVPVRCDTDWWASIWGLVDAAVYWHGRLHHELIDAGPSPQTSLLFPGLPEPELDMMDGGPATFPSAVLGLNVSQRRFRAAFEGAGAVVVP